MAIFPIQPGNNPKNCESLQALLQGVIDENAEPADMVPLANQ